MQAVNRCSSNCFSLSLFILFVIANLNFANAQGILGKIKKGLQDVTDIAYQAAVLSKLAGATTEEFNKTVKVVKGDNGNKSKTVPPDKITPLKITKGEIKNITWQPFIGFDGQLFPSSIISLAAYKGPTTPQLESIIRPIGIRFVSKYENIPIKWEIESVDKKYFDKISGDYLYDFSKQEVLLNPEIPWNYQALAKQDASTPVSFIFRFFDDAGNKVEKTESAYIRSINDCLRGYDKTPLFFLYTGYIQEEHPEIPKILKQATDTKIVDAIAGYQGGADFVDLQVAAVWKVLHDKGINYSSITTTAGSGEKIYSQVVRTFDKALNEKQANCVDGTVVLASILRKMGIHTVMMIVKGHCFLGYYRKADDDKGNRQDISFIETTVLAESKYIDAAITKAKVITDNKKADVIINKGYIDQFAYALYEGKKAYDEHKAANTIYDMIDVDKERLRLIQPIPF